MKKLVFIFVFLFAISFKLFGQWQILNSPSATPDIRKLLLHPDGYIIAITNGSEIFRSDNDQIIWSKIATLTSAVYCLKISPEGTIYAGMTGGYATSVDGGLTWVYKSISPNLVRNIVDIEFNSSGYIYMIQDYYYPTGVWVSPDYGQSWSIASIGLSTNIWRFDGLIKDSFDSLYVLVDYYNNGSLRSDLYKWNDIGQYWSFVSTCPSSGKIEIDSDNNMYVLDAYVYKSTDFGNSWNLTYSYLYGDLYIDSLNRIFCFANSDGIFYSSDGGYNWENINHYGLRSFSLLVLDSTIYSATNLGLLKSTNLGSSWVTCFRDNDRVANVSNLLKISDNTFLAACSNAGLLLSTNNFFSWETTKINGGVNLIKKDNIGNIYASSDFLYRSTDEGLTWEIPYNIDPDNPRYTTNFFINDSGYIFTIQNYGLPASYSTVYKSKNYGLTWDYLWDNTCACYGGAIGYSVIEDLSGDLFTSYYFSKGPPGPFTQVAIMKVKPDGTETIVYEWKIANNMYLYNQALYMATNGYSSSQSLGVIKTTDNGNNFIQLNNGLTNLNIKQLILKPGVFIALTGDGIFCSLDEGNYWTPFNLSGLNANINSVYLDDNQTLYACTDNGIYVFTGVLNVEDEIIPTIFVLQQNYPNPFNPCTSIQYAISSRQFVSLKVYDVLGKEIATLVNEEKSAGSYETVFSASHLASGIYYYQLRAGDYVETKKMILLK